MTYNPNINYQSLRETVIVSGVSPAFSQVLAPQSGFSYSINQIWATNQDDYQNGITFYEDTTSKLFPTAPVAASGSLIWSPNDLDGGIELATSSGLNANLVQAGSFEVTVYYYLLDERTPITKSQARANTFNNAIAIRRPNIRGEQALS